MNQDRFAANADTVSNPARSCVAIAPSDSDGLQAVPKALYIGSGGDLTVRCIDDEADVTFRNLPDGMILAIRSSHVRATGTTAAQIVGLL